MCLITLETNTLRILATVYNSQYTHRWIRINATNGCFFDNNNGYLISYNIHFEIQIQYT